MQFKEVLAINKIDLYNNFSFNRYHFAKYNYTDNTKGSPKNFVGYIIKGTAKIVSEQGTLLLNPSDVFFIPCNLSYQSYWYSEDSIDFISIGYLDLLVNEPSGYLLQKVDCSDEIKEKMIRLPKNGNDMTLDGLRQFYDIMSTLVPLLESSAKNRNECIVNTIKECIKNNPSAPISHIASLCSISQPYLYTVFKKVTNETPNEYRTKALLNAAVMLLTTTDKKVEEISKLTNFSSSSYFRKVLKKYTGKTPKEIRKNREL